MNKELLEKGVEMQNIPEKNQPQEPELSANYLHLPSLEVKAPVIWQTEFNEKTIQANLKNGVIHLKGTALPGETGNIVITGHSSYFPWAKGSYKAIFATLPKIQINDQIYLNKDNIEYIYKVNNIFEVTPDKTEVMMLGNQSQLTLITCTPVGTATRRLIVQAEQISPDPEQNKPFPGEPIAIPQQIPDGR